MSVQIGRYHLVKCLARGGMAEIWLAQQRAEGGFEKLVAVKRILPGLANRKEFIKMFLDEARLAAQLGHPNIVQIYDLGRTGETYYIAMEFIHGENLRMITRAAAEGDGIPLPFAVKIISETATALHYAHTKTALDGTRLGVVHRDVSPQNLLVSYEGQVKVVDFGIAKAAGSLTETRTGVIKGKYPYMSPEQVMARKIDGRSDLFSLGIVFWEILTGHRLYDQPTDFLVMDAIVKKPPPLASTIRPEIPTSLEALLMKALAKSPRDRFPDCHSFHQALERWLHGVGEMVSAVELSAFMHGCFPDRLATWDRLLEQRDQVDFSSEVLDELSGFMGMTPSSELGTGASEALMPSTRVLRAEASQPRAAPRVQPRDLGAEPAVRARDAAPCGSAPASRPPLTPAPPVAPLRAHTDPGVRPPEMLEAAPELDAGDEPLAPPAQQPHPLPALQPHPDPGPARDLDNDAEEESEEDALVPRAPVHDTHRAGAGREARKAPPARARRRRRSLQQRIDRVFEPAATLLGRLLQGVLALITIAGMIWVFQGVLESADLTGRENEIARNVALNLATGAGIVTPGVLLARSYPGGATVRFDGRKVGVTPMSWPIVTRKKSVWIELRLEGYRPWKRKVDDPAAGVRIEAQLEPALGTLKR